MFPLGETSGDCSDCVSGPKSCICSRNISWAHIGLAVSFGALLVCGCGAQGCISQDTYLLGQKFQKVENDENRFFAITSSKLFKN